MTEVELQSKPFGKIRILDEQILSFPEGILGFSEFNRYALIEETEDSPFKWLQSVDEPDLAFIVIQPEMFLKDYSPVLKESEISEIGLKNIKDALVFVIVTIPGNDPDGMTANLQGPILINKKNLTARQFISRNDSHSVRVRIMDHLQ